MWISILEINNIKSFEASGTISLDRKMNILLGQNSAGKSTIIRMLYLLQQAGSLTLQDIRVGQIAASGFMKLEDIDNEHYRALVEDNKYSPFVYMVANKNSNVHLQMVNVTDTKLPINPVAPREPVNFIYPYLSKRKVAGYSQNVNDTTSRDVLDNLNNLVSKVDRLSNKYSPNHDEFEEACIAILGFPITTFQAGSGKQAGIMVDDFTNIPLEAMGEGVPNLLGLIVNLCMAKNQLFLIEEIENDVEPRALKGLLNLVIKKAEYNQFVISTHSNIVARYLGSIHDSKVHQITLAPYTPTNRVPTATYKELETYEERREALEALGYELNDYDLAEGWLIFEESSAERIIREYLIPWFVPALAGKVRTIAAQGTTDVEPKFVDFNRLFLFLHLEHIYQNRAWVIIDGDKTGLEAITKLRARYIPSSWPEDHFRNLTKHNFEEYYPKRFSDQIIAALQTHGKEAKRKAKKELLEQVLSWIRSDEQQAKAEFASSACEIIEILREIESKI